MRAEIPLRSSVPWLVGGVLLAAAAAAALVLLGEPVAGGIALAAATVLSSLARARAERTGSPRLAFADNVAERVMEAGVLAAIAWAALPGQASWAAVTALVTSYVASYLPVKALGLGFRIDEHLPFRTIRLGLVALGLLFTEWLAYPLWAASALSLWAIARHGLSVARQREPA